MKTKTMSRTKSKQKTEQLEILEAAWYAIFHHFDDLAYFLDFSDESMMELRRNIRSKIDAKLEEK